MRDPEEELEEASVDSAVEAMEEHSQERAAHERQGLIERNTREDGLDEG